MTEREEIIERVERSSIPIPESGCLIWLDGTNNRGYGQLGWHGKRYGAHRFIWMAYFGEIPKGYFVCHKCDERSCVNINHLFLGTPKDNTSDMVAKNRAAIGEKHAGAKLTEDAVRAIRKEYASGESQSALGRKYEVSDRTIGNVVRYERWKHVR